MQCLQGLESHRYSPRPGLALWVMAQQGLLMLGSRSCGTWGGGAPIQVGSSHVDTRAWHWARQPHLCTPPLPHTLGKSLERGSSLGARVLGLGWHSQGSWAGETLITAQHVGLQSASGAQARGCPRTPGGFYVLEALTPSPGSRPEA